MHDVLGSSTFTGPTGRMNTREAIQRMNEYTGIVSHRPISRCTRLCEFRLDKGVFDESRTCFDIRSRWRNSSLFHGHNFDRRAFKNLADLSCFTCVLCCKYDFHVRYFVTIVQKSLDKDKWLFFPFLIFCFEFLGAELGDFGNEGEWEGLIERELDRTHGSLVTL